MKEIYPIEGTVLVDKYRIKTYLFYLRKRPALLRYFVPHLFFYVMFALHLISKDAYNRHAWNYLTKDLFDQYQDELMQRILLKQHSLIDPEGIYISFASEFLNDAICNQLPVLILKPFDDTRECVYHAVKQAGIQSYACIHTMERSLRKHASQIYELKKGILVEQTIGTICFGIAKQLACIAILSLLITMITLALTPLNSHVVYAYLQQPLVVFMNFLPIFVVMLVLYGLCNNLSGAFTLCGIFFLILAEINRFKMSFRDDPFVFLDVKYAKEAAQMTSNYTLFIDKMTALVIVVFLVTLLWLLLRHRPKTQQRSFRIAYVIIPLLLFGSTFTLLYNNADIYNAMWNDTFGNQWKEANQFTARGFNYSFLRTVSSATIREPDGYDEAFAENTLAQYETIAISEDQKVNVIGIMLEAYNDLTALESNAVISEEVYRNFHQIQQESYSGFLYTDIFAGGTIATERSFLSGFSALGEFRRPTQTYVSYFKDQGYYTEAMHPCYGWFYNRKNVNEIGFGFDRFDYHENVYEDLIDTGEIEDTFFGFLYDTDFFQQIISGYEANRARQMPYFNFSVTYQNHGPYSSEKLIEEEYLKWNDAYSLEDYNIVNNYLDDIYMSDQALGELYDYINAQEEPIVLVFFGDHNPYLGEENSGFAMLDINLDLGTVEGSQNYYQTPYVITANQAAKDVLHSDVKGKGDTISPMFLMNELFEATGIHAGTPYSQYLNDLKQEIDVINPLYLKENGTFKLREEAETSEKLQEFNIIQYYQQYAMGK